jgi:hypothetical protein
MTSATYYAAHKAELRIKNRVWKKAHPDKVASVLKAWHTRLKAEVIAAYGDKCACCGESRLSMLTIDHIDGKGNDHRREIGWSNTYSWLRKNNYPAGFQILCWNCNGSKEMLGHCEHEEGVGCLYT